MGKPKKKVLLIRLDKIGDLICTLPVDQILDLAAYEITWVIQKGMGELVDLGLRRRNYIEVDKNQPKLARALIARLIKKNRFDISVSFQAPWWVNWLLFKHNVPRRIGVLSLWHSYVFLNDGVRQRRSESVKHEFEYNLELVTKITGPIQQLAKDIVFQFRKPHSSNWISHYNLGTRYIVVHPGMMGSALNWKQSQYINKIQSLIDEQYVVVITGTKSDDPYLTEIKTIFESHPQVRWLQGKLDFERLLEIIFYSEKIIAPSTGVAHIAASLGRSLEAIFSPIKVHHPKRWAPRGLSEDQVRVCLPDVYCHAQFKCLGKLCSDYNCMDRVVV